MRLIDADELKVDYGFTWDDITPTHEELYALIDRQPTIDPVKKGKWRKQNNEYSYWYECSECGCEPLWSRFYGEFDFSAFCPNCGAKMEEPEDIPMEYFENGGN